VEELGAGSGGGHTIGLEPYGYRWFRHGKLDQALVREPVG
jgi:hypothetical protein